MLTFKQREELISIRRKQGVLCAAISSLEDGKPHIDTIVGMYELASEVFSVLGRYANMETIKETPTGTAAVPT